MPGPVAGSATCVGLLPPGLVAGPAIVDGPIELLDVPGEQRGADVLLQPQRQCQQLLEINRRGRQPQPAEMRQRTVDDGVGADVEELAIDVPGQALQIERALRMAQRDVQHLMRD